MSNSAGISSGKAASVLTGAVVIGWAVCYWPARMLKGDSGVAWMTVAAVACLVPGWIVVFLSRLAIFRDHLALMLAQTGVRLVSVMGVAIGVKFFRPQLGVADFFGWLIGFYLLMLLVEVMLMQRKRPVAVPSSELPDRPSASETPKAESR